MVEVEPEIDYHDPGAEVDMAGADFVPALASVLTQLANNPTNVQVRHTSFHSVRAPPLTVRDYLSRIARYFQCSFECFVLALVYIDRIVKQHPEFTICTLT